MSGKLGNEKYSVQKPIIQYVSESKEKYNTSSENEKIFIKLGWEYVSPTEALKLRGGKDKLIFKDIFKHQMIKLNPFLTYDEVEELIKKLEKIPSNIKGNLTALEYLKGLKTLFIKSEKRERNIKFIDTTNIDNNVFQVTEEFDFDNGTNRIRPDIVFFINGIPIIIIETKAANKINGLNEGLEQIIRYHRECPEIMTMLQIYGITNITKYYYGATWNTSTKSIFNWKEEIQGDFETIIKSFFDRERIVKLITDYILFTKQDDELKKIILRPHQIRAVEKIIERAKDSEKKRGLIWHTQGSGKTYTMIVTAKKLLENPIFENPTVLMIVDRNELESQLFGNLKSVGIENIEIAESKRHLQELLRRGRRGLIVTMIHKFEDMPENINTRKNIFVLIDEAHRSISGDLGNYMMRALPNATYIGFTGTPIDKTNHGKGTFKIFGIDDQPSGYLDRYKIAESIEDGTTVSLHYTLAPNELRIDKETLEKEFLNLPELQGVSDIEDLNKILIKAVNLKNMLKSPDRIDNIAKYIANHYKEYVEPMGYKAFIVAVDREACVLYKENLDKYLPSNYSQVVISSSHNDPEHLKKHYISKEEEKRIRKNFKNPKELPKILIVTDKLLTGFDAPILYCMYLDKPMRDHVLLQAIARVNRPYEDEEGIKKPSGFVLDFVGIFENLEKALAFDSSDITGVVQDIKILKEKFSNLMKEAEKKYITIIEGKTQDKAVESILNYFMEDKIREEFFKFYKELTNIYEILSPDPFLGQYIENYDNISRMFIILKEAYEPKASINKELSKKTAQLVQKHTKPGKIQPNLEIFEINEEVLKKLEESKASDVEKTFIFNLGISIQNTIEKEKKTIPYLIKIGEKAEKLIESFKNRQKNTQETLEELKKIINEINAVKKEQIGTNTNPEIFTIRKILKERLKEKVNNINEIVNQIEEIVKKYPYWYKGEKQEREFKQEFISILSKSDININYEEVISLLEDIKNTFKGARE